MTKGRAIAGLAAGILMIASAAAHSLLGWKALAAELTAAGATGDLVRNLAMGWHFGGVAMLVFGLLALELFLPAWRGGVVATAPARLVGAAYALFGVVAMAMSDWNPFFLVFFVPGALLVFAASGKSVTAAGTSPG